MKLNKKIFITVPHLHNYDSVSGSALTQFIFLKKFFKTYLVSQYFSEQYDFISFKKMFEILTPQDIVIYHFAGSFEYLEKVRKKCRLIMYYHNITPAELYTDYPSVYEMLKNSENKFLNCVDRNQQIICPSEFSKNKLENFEFKNVAVIPMLYNYTNSEIFNKNLYEKLVNENKKIILCVSRILPHKNQLELIKQFQKLSKKINDSKLVFIGEKQYKISEYYTECVELVKKNNIKNVVFEGLLKLPEKNAYYKAAGLYASFSLHEGFCIPVAEAINFNLPVTALDNGSSKELVCGSSLLGSPEEFSECAENIFRDLIFRQNIISVSCKKLKKINKNLFHRFYKIL